MTDLTVITHDAETFVAYLHSIGARSVADLTDFERTALLAEHMHRAAA